ncbi:hypothetical protein M1K46_22655 [Fictibacillus sp. WQ 8-8]|uniref:hypothetical protein n=1 Tax=Fictibacillus sp. WQ 8-8 TaxID=2938788 RepID=UPI00210D6584|nr:hypothetical protein [Fictibacillus sp. WQ 8-8]MCQ6268391.1 hypothetical protein [Fictibacillus sp. WQ 8-8]
MVKKGQRFVSYSDDFKQKAVMKYVNGSKSYEALAEKTDRVWSFQFFEFLNTKIITDRAHYFIRV